MARYRGRRIGTPAKEALSVKVLNLLAYTLCGRTKGAAAVKDLVRPTLEQDERRTYARAVKFISGCVLVDEEILNCMVIDLSINGARLLFDRPLPDFAEATVRFAFKLRLASPVDLAMKVAWRDSMMLGVTFLDDPRDVAVALESLLPKECLSFTGSSDKIAKGGNGTGSAD